MWAEDWRGACVGFTPISDCDMFHGYRKPYGRSRLTLHIQHRSFVGYPVLVHTVAQRFCPLPSCGTCTALHSKQSRQNVKKRPVSSAAATRYQAARFIKWAQKKDERFRMRPSSCWASCVESQQCGIYWERPTLHGLHTSVPLFLHPTPLLSPRPPPRSPFCLSLPPSFSPSVFFLDVSSSL